MFVPVDSHVVEAPLTGSTGLVPSNISENWSYVILLPLCNLLWHFICVLIQPQNMVISKWKMAFFFLFTGSISVCCIETNRDHIFHTINIFSKCTPDAFCALCIPQYGRVRVPPRVSWCPVPCGGCQLSTMWRSCAVTMTLAVQVCELYVKEPVKKKHNGHHLPI